RPTPNESTLFLGPFGVTLLEAIDSACRVDQLLLACEEWMALRADLDAQLLLRRTGRPRLAASAVDLDLMILRMDLCFHGLTLVRRTNNRQYMRKILRAAQDAPHNRAM